ncbi:unnamed protein product [Echinostoma caproni]|uniref:Gag-pol polyprotein n=1 Tax=Echinostoma caproni TaxID=27848 RepID=A0A183B0C3_9TREM|nr:unnamed protein product [Echinostoma caproni]
MTSLTLALTGNHGYSTNFTDMSPFFLAHGPSFLVNKTIPLVHAVDVYSLLSGLLGIFPHVHQGNLTRIANQLLKPDVAERVVHTPFWFPRWWAWLMWQLQTFWILMGFSLWIVLLALLVASVHVQRREVRMTFGSRRLTVDLRLPQVTTWDFIVADVPFPILGMDFLQHFGLPVDTRRHLLTGLDCNFTVHGQGTTLTAISLIFRKLPYGELLSAYPAITQSSDILPSVTTPVTYSIRTSGPPVFSRARRLAPDKLRVAKAEFDRLLKAGNIRPSDSSWASPLHMIPKKESADWRPYGDYHAPNRVTTHDC